MVDIKIGLFTMLPCNPLRQSVRKHRQLFERAAEFALFLTFLIPGMARLGT